MHRPSLIALFLLATPLPAFAGGGVVDTTRTVGEFTGVGVGAGIHATITEGPFAPIAIRGEADAVKHIRVEVKDGSLQVGYEENSEIKVTTPTEVTIRMPRASSLAVGGGAVMTSSVPCGDVLSLAASGGGQLRVTANLRPDKLALAASGGAQVTVTSLETHEAALQLSGASKVAVAGRAENVQLAVSGAADLNAASLATRDLNIAGSGGSTAAVRAERAGGALSGGATLRVPAGAQSSVVEGHGAHVEHNL